ncbi:cytochrome P450 [Polymorphospora sp. NPDC051019]|uniref:cytochrome P450 n=1 Tax=Polymorphospora sp. NPDC051019 TaxID=3155725 RepID=UPI003427149B
MNDELFIFAIIDGGVKDAVIAIGDVRVLSRPTDARICRCGGTPGIHGCHARGRTDLRRQEMNIIGEEVQDAAGAPDVAGGELFDPLSPEFIDNPYRTYREMRSVDPVHWHAGLSAWILTTYRDCRRVVEDSTTFAADYRRAGVPMEPQTITVQTLDPPDQLPVRRLLAEAFRAQRTPAIRRELVPFVRGKLAELARREEFDLVAELAVPLATFAMSGVFGGDLARGDEFRTASTAVVRSMIAGVAPERERPGLEARALLADLIRTEYERGPTTGILGFLYRGNAHHAVGTDLLTNSLRAVLLAGLNTGQRFLGNSVHGLLQQPGRVREFAGMPARERTTALHELLRHDTPFQAQERIVTTDARIGGRQVRRGDRVVVLFGAAHRDPAVFAEPDELVLSRTPNPHFGFGRGVHACLGAALAFAEADVLLSELATHPAVRLAAPPVREPNPTLRGLATLPVRLGTDD